MSEPSGDPQDGPAARPVPAHRTPRWVILSGAAALVVVVIIVIVHLAGGGFSHLHGAGR